MSVANGGVERTRRRPVSLESHIKSREAIIASYVYSEFRGLGIPDKQADKLAKKALRRARKVLDEAIPDVTKVDYKQIKIRR